MHGPLNVKLISLFLFRGPPIYKVFHANFQIKFIDKKLIKYFEQADDLLLLVDQNIIEKITFITSINY